MDPWHLPLEIVLLVLQELDVGLPKNSENSNALKAFALSCSALLPFCQKILFRHVLLILPQERFLDDVLKNSPHIASYVQVFGLTLTPSALEDGPISVLTRIITALDRLTELQLDWRANFPSSRILNWTVPIISHPGKEFRQTISSVLGSKDLIGLDVRNIDNFPWSTFTRRGKVLDVTERESHWIAINIVECGMDQLTPSYAQVRNYSTGMLWEREMTEVLVDGLTCLSSEGSVLPPLNLSSARSLSVWCRHHLTIPRINKVMRCAPSIEALYFTVLNTATFASGHETLSRTILATCVRILTTLHISFIGTFGRPADDTSIGLCSELQQLSGHNNIRNIALVLDHNVKRYPIDERDLKVLDSTFHRHGFPQLQTLDITFHASNTDTPNADNQPSMEGLHRHNLLHLVNLQSIEGLRFTSSTKYIQIR